MKKTKKLYSVLLIAAVFVAGSTFMSMASSKNKITSIKVSFKDNIVRDGAIDADQVEFTASSDKYDITGWEFENDGLDWQESDIPRITVQFETGDDYYFSVSKDSIKVKGDKATVDTTKKEDSQTLKVTFALTPISSRVGKIDYAYLEGNTATWAPASGATGYEIYLYRNAEVVGSKKSTTETTLDLGSSMLKDGSYYYQVRGVGAAGFEPGPYTESGAGKRDEAKKGTSAGLNNSNAQASAGNWKTDTNGWWWQRADGSWPSGSWEQIDSKWYFFNEGGYRVSGWIFWNDFWYYMGADGDMWVNCQTPDGYMVNADGVRVVPEGETTGQQTGL